MNEFEAHQGSYDHLHKKVGSVFRLLFVFLALLLAPLHSASKK